MKIGIFGCYNSGSIGDHAILLGILNHFQHLSKDSSPIIFSFHYSSIENAIKNAIVSKILTSLKEYKISKAIPYNEQSRASVRSNTKENKPVKQQIKELLMRHSKLYKLVLTIDSLGLPTDLYLLFKSPYFWYRKYKEIRGLDLMIIGGGNLLMDLYNRWPIYVLLYTVMAKLAHVPVMFYAIGAGPIRSWRGRCYLRISCNLADKITFRDQESLEIIKNELNINITKLSLSADPAVSLHREQEKKHVESLSRPLIGMTIVPYYSPHYWPNPNKDVYENYKNSMATAIESIIEQFGARIIFFTTNYPVDLQSAQEVVKKIKYTNQVEIITRQLSVPEILRTEASCDIVIGTRLHSLILSLVSGTPFLAISYQPKVEAFCRRIDLDRYILNLSNTGDISKNRLLFLLQDLIENTNIVRTCMKEQLSILRDAAEYSCEMAIKLVKT